MSAITFSFMSPVVRAAAAAAAPRNGGAPPAALSNDVLVAARGDAQVFNQALRDAWAAEVAGGKPSLLTALRRTFLRDLLVAAAFKLAWSALIVTCASFFVRFLLSWVREPTPSFAGWVVACCFFAACIALSVTLQQVNVLSSRLGSRVSAALAAELYEKSLREDRLSNPHPVDVVSLVATDCTKLQEAGSSINFLWSAVVESLAIIAVLLGLIGVSALPGLGLILLIIPAQYALGLAVAKLRKSISEVADARVQRMDEILRAIKLVKCYAWERPFSALVNAYRAREVALLRWSGVLKTVNLALVFALPPLIALSIFGVHTIGSRLDGVTAFTTLSLFNTLRLPLVILPKCLRSFAEALAALKRVESYLLAPERAERPKHERREIVLTDASYTFGGAQPLLRGLTLSIPPGRLVMVFGPVGSGKTNLVLAMLGRMNLLSGTEAVGGRFAYVPQKPWCQFGTVRDNILFGLPFDEARYKRVLHACALEHDLNVLSDGDQTMLGERGMNISGGQQQRIALARAAYSAADTFLLDSPLSAVDMYTSQHIFRHCVKGLLLKGGRTVVLVTHQVELLPEADTVVVMDRGAFGFCGPYTRAVGARLGVPDEMPSGSSSGGEHGAGAGAGAEPDASAGGGSSGSGDEPHQQQQLDRKHSQRRLSSRSPMLAPEARERALSMRASILSAGLGAGSGGLLGAPAVGSGGEPDSEVIRRLVTSVRLRTTSAGTGSIILAPPLSPAPASNYHQPQQPPHVKLQLGAPPAAAAAGAGVDPLCPVRPPALPPRVNGYHALVSETGPLLVLLSVTIFAGTQTIRIASDAWIQLWVSSQYPGRSEVWYLQMYSGYVAAFIVALLCRGLFFYSIFRAATTRLHNLQFRQILRAPLAFFTVTPVGRVLSVFSKDQDQIDEALLDNIHMTTIYTAILLTTMGVVIRVLPFFAAICGLLALAFVWFFRRYMRASAGIKALVGEANSLLLAHVSETLQGMAVIQAYEAQGRFVADNRRRIRNMHLAGGALDDLQGWLSFRMDTVASLLVLGTCLLCVGLRATISSSMAGLAISNSFQILLFMTLMVKGAADIHANIPSVERVVQNVKVASEPDVPLDHGSCPQASWPAHGEVSFHGVVMSYAADTPAVLKGVDFTVGRGEKIGIVGRTGAGKSSLVAALFRLADLSKGEVRIDGLNTTVLNLTELRRRIAIVPQEPVLFNGTLRSNLDPFGVHDDGALLEALERCNLGGFVADQKAGLDCEITTSGGNFSLSLGQAQLISLARAVLNKSKLLILDEATSALDLETDRLVQQTIRSVFADRTVLCVAHRLDTIIDSDRILVMSEGRVAEFDTPLALLQRDSIFRGLCEQTGAQFERLYAAALLHTRTLDALRAQAAREVEEGEEGGDDDDNDDAVGGFGAGGLLPADELEGSASRSREEVAGGSPMAAPRDGAAGGGRVGLATVPEADGEEGTLGRGAGAAHLARWAASASDPEAGGSEGRGQE